MTKGKRRTDAPERANGLQPRETPTGLSAVRGEVAHLPPSVAQFAEGTAPEMGQRSGSRTSSTAHTSCSLHPVVLLISQIRVSPAPFLADMRV